MSQIRALILPAFALGVGGVGYLARLVRASLPEVAGEDHIRTARAFGHPETRIVFRHALRLAIVPSIAILAVGLGSILASAVSVETVFGRPASAR